MADGGKIPFGRGDSYRPARSKAARAADILVIEPGCCYQYEAPVFVSHDYQLLAGFVTWVVRSVGVLGFFSFFPFLFALFL